MPKLQGIREMVDKMTDLERRALISQYLDQYDENHPYHELVDQHNILMDVMAATRNKRGKPHIQGVIGYEYENVFQQNDRNKLLKTIRNVQLILASDSFYPPKHKPVTKWDTTKNKPREFVRPDYRDESIVHHAMIRMIMPQLTKGMYHYTCASIPHRGVHYLHRRLSKIISNDPKNTKYVLKLDIRNFFGSIPHRNLKKCIKRIVKHDDMRKLFYRVIESTKYGVPLGFFTSQWFANYYLQPLDHYIKERILVDCGCNVERTGRYGASYYFRYMDDMVIFGPNKKELHKMKDKIIQTLEEDYGLKVRPDWQVFRFDHIDKKTGKRKGRPLDYVGYQFFHDKTIIRKSTYKRIKRLIKHLRKKDITHVTFKEATQMLSYYGFIHWSDAKGLYTKLLKPYIKLKDLKKIVKKEYKARAKAIKEKRELLKKGIDPKEAKKKARKEKLNELKKLEKHKHQKKYNPNAKGKNSYAKKSNPKYKDYSKKNHTSSKPKSNQNSRNGKMKTRKYQQSQRKHPPKRPTNK